MAWSEGRSVACVARYSEALHQEPQSFKGQAGRECKREGRFELESMRLHATYGSVLAMDWLAVTLFDDHNEVRPKAVLATERLLRRFFYFMR